MKNKLLFTLSLFFLMAMNLSAATWWVASSGTGDGSSEANASNNLAAIITGAAAGDTINIVGTYTQTTLIGVSTPLNFVGVSGGTLDGTSGSAGFMQLNNP
jgi:Na+-transporting NADH:ubiquinone oxidoreductase subunit NqrB